MTAEEQFDADTKKAMKASREATRTIQFSGGLSKGAGVTLEAPDEPKASSVAKVKHDIVIDWGSKEESDKSNENVDAIPWVSTSDEENENKNDDDDDQSIDIEETDNDRTYSDNGDQVMTDAEKNVAKKQKKNKKEKAEVPRSSLSRSLSSNYGNQFLNISSDASFVGIIKETTEAESNYLLDVQIQQEIPSVLSALLLDFLVFVIPPQATTTSTPLITLLNTPLYIQPIKSTATTTTPTVPDPLPTVVRRVPSVVDEYLGSTLGDTLQKVLQKHTKKFIQHFLQKSASKIIKVKQEQVSKDKIPTYSSTPYDQQANEEHKQKDILFKMMMASKSYERHPAYKALYDTLLESIFVEENNIDRIAKDHASQRKRRHDDKDKDLSVGSDQGKKKRKNGKKSKSSRKSFASKESSKGKTPLKSSKVGKSVYADETVEEATHEVEIDVEEFS
nr:hypothetical protein [Tanacetum cinerariifolium]